MTRNDIAKSLKPIEWVYSHELCTYKATMNSVGGEIELEIKCVSNSPAKARLLALRNNRPITGCKILHKTLDSAMEEARNLIITDVCSLFNLGEQ